MDYNAAHPFWHDDVVIFGTYQELVKSRQLWADTQWDNVWPRTANFCFDLAKTEVMASADASVAVVVAPGPAPSGTPTVKPSTAPVVPP